MTTRVSYQALKEYLAIIKADFDVDIRLQNTGRGVNILRYRAYEGKQPDVLRCKSKGQALAELKQIHAELFGF